jgi:NADH:quinone reductase (non-electrogenic)
LPPKLSVATHIELTKLNIDIITSERVVKVEKNTLITHTGRIIPAAIKVWAAGIKAPDFLNRLDGLEVNKINQLVVKQTLQTTEDKNIFALGDCAQCDWKEMKTHVPPRAQSAHQQASLLVKSMRARINDKPLPEFKYKDYGSLVSLGKYSTVGNLMGNLTGTVMVEGFFARIVYLSLYKIHQLALFGFYRTMMLSLAHALRSTVHPEIKLH